MWTEYHQKKEEDTIENSYNIGEMKSGATVSPDKTKVLYFIYCKHNATL